MVITRKIYKESRLNIEISAVLALPKRLFPLRRVNDEKLSVVQQRLLRMYSYILIVGRRAVDRKNYVVKCFFKRERVVVGFNRKSLLWSSTLDKIAKNNGNKKTKFKNS